MEALRGAGLRPEGIDLSAFGMIRALAREVSGNLPMPAQQDPAAPAPAPTRLYCNLGDVTNLAVARGSTCLFTRVSSFGIEGVAQRLSERRKLSLDHARQWLNHVGLEQPLEQVEGDHDTVAVTRDLLVEGVAKLTDEVRLSLEFFGAQEGSLAVEGIVACGPGSAIPGLLDRLSSELGQAVSPGRPAALAGIDAATAARLTLSYGLALRN
jgi:type IV pilus assembly protein PilM